MKLLVCHSLQRLCASELLSEYEGKPTMQPVVANEVKQSTNNNTIKISRKNKTKRKQKSTSVICSDTNTTTAPSLRS